jgi:antitoxin HicB
MIQFQAKIYKDGDSYSVEFPDLPGCFSMGSSLEEAKEMASDALSLYLEEARDPQWKIPAPKYRKNKNLYWIQPRFDIGIAILIRHARLKHGLTQSQLAQRVGITVQQLQKLETPGKSNPTVKTLAAISKALDEDLKIELAS